VLTTPLAACSGLEGTGDKGYITGDGTVREFAAEDRGEAIELTGEGLDGEPLDLGDLRGEIAVVNVWGSWCPPCRAEMPDLVGAAQETDDVASFVGINIRESSTDTAQAFNRTFDVAYPSFYSFDGQALLAFSGTITPNSIPSTIVLDPEGRVAGSVIGPLPSQQTLVDLVEGVAAESSPAPGDGDDGGGDGGGEGGSGRG
jgi:thiol-disulfide isomerase/thioredoxin